MKSSHFSTVVISLLLLCLVVVGITVFQNKFSVLTQSTSFPTNQLAQTAGSGTSSCTVVCSGLVSYWPFNDGSGTTAADVSGSGNNGVLVNSPTWTTGEVGSGALSFNGTNQYVSAPSDPSGTGAATFSAWIYPTAWSAQKDIIADQQGAFEFFVQTSYPTTTGSVLLSDNGGTNKCTSPSASLMLNTWYLVTGTRDASGNCVLYINGAQVSSGAAGAPIAGTTLAIGSRVQPAFYFSGTIDDVRIYNRVLAPSEVATLYSGSSAGSSSGSNPPPSTYTLTLTNGGNGAVTSNPTGINCGSTCTLSSLTSGTQVTLTASPGTGYTASWTGCTSSNGNACTVTMGSANAMVGATFTQSTNVTLPTISSVTASSVTTSGATITWTTNTDTSSQILYGLTTTYGSQTALDSTLTQSHSVTLSGLSPDTFYYYSVKSVDASGNLVQSAGGAMFTTLPSSPPPPSGTGGNVHWVSTNGTASWSGCAASSPLSGTAACPMAVADADAMPGDTVYLRGGTYNNGQLLQPSNSGSAGSPINFTAYNGENVTLTSEFIPDGQMTTSWQACSSPICVSGASAALSNAEWWNNPNGSTQFTTTAAGQGITSGNFTLPAPYNSNGYDFYACVYSSSNAIQVNVIGGKGTSVPLYSKDVALYPNLWTCFSSSYIASSGQAGSNAYVTFTSPSTTPANTWYVADVRMHIYSAEISLTGKSYINISGVNVNDADQAFLLQEGSSYNQISNGTFTNVDQYSTGVITGPNGATQEAPSSYNWIHNDVFHDNGSVTWTGTACFENGDTLRIGESGDLDDYSMGNLVENNVFYHSSHDAILVATKYNTIRNNVFHNEAWFPDHYIINGLGCGVLTNPAPDLGARDLLFQAAPLSPDDYAGYNLVEGNRLGFAGTPYTQGANDIENPTSGNIIRFNYLYKADASGIEFKESSTDHISDPSHNHIYNNTFYDNGGGASIDTIKQGAIQINGVSAGFTPPVGNAIVNNITYDNTTQFTGSLPLTSFEAYGNTVSNNSTANPLFNNPDVSNPSSLTLPDLSIQAGSPDINAGGALTNVTSPSGSGTTLVVKDAQFFQDSTWGPPGRLQPDWIAVGTVGNVAQISSINYTTNTITLATPLAYKTGDSVWLYKDSTGQQVLFGSAPDIGAYQYPTSGIGSGETNPLITTPTNTSNSSSAAVPASGSGSSGGTGGNTASGGSSGLTGGTGGSSGSSGSSGASATSVSASASPSATSAFPVSLSLGSTGTDVKNLQVFLNTEGYTIAKTGPGSAGDETTYFGTLTSEALRRFQTAHSLSSTGVLDAATEAFINNTIVSVPTTPSVSPSSVALFTRALSLGMTGTDVKNLQVFLNTQGFTIAASGSGSTGHETTYFGSLTKVALIRFQDSYASTILAPYGLSKGTGYFGSATMKAVNAIIDNSTQGNTE